MDTTKSPNEIDNAHEHYLNDLDDALIQYAMPYYYGTGDFMPFSELPDRVKKQLTASRCKAFMETDCYDAFEDGDVPPKAVNIMSDYFDVAIKAKTKNELEWALFKAGRKIIPLLAESIKEKINEDLINDYEAKLACKITESKYEPRSNYSRGAFYGPL